MKSFEEIPDIAERIKRSKMELQESGFYLAPEWDSQSCCDQDYVNNFKKGWESRQTEVDELQKRVDAVKGLAQTLWEKSEEKHHQGKVWESKTLGECADEILDVLEQALKGGDQNTEKQPNKHAENIATKGVKGGDQ